MNEYSVEVLTLKLFKIFFFFYIPKSFVFALNELPVNCGREIHCMQLP